MSIAPITAPAPLGRCCTICAPSLQTWRGTATEAVTGVDETTVANSVARASGEAIMKTAPSPARRGAVRSGLACIFLLFPTYTESSIPLCRAAMAATRAIDITLRVDAQQQSGRLRGHAQCRVGDLRTLEDG